MNHLDEKLIYVISDSVGETAELVVKAAGSQFKNVSTEIERFPYVNDTETVEEIVTSAKENDAMIVFTLVVPEIRQKIIETSEALNVPFVDVMGPVMSKMEKVFASKPIYEPGLVHKLDEDYFKRIEAIEFAVKYDDGRDPRGIMKADVVLVGVSRTSKTPLSQYLALKRLKVANVPLVP
ncbi:MAG: pyruvate, water dikinase regulatory protein, partial [Tuberibacillus sp.]